MNSIADALCLSAQRDPSRVAFRCQEEALTYQQLATQAAQLANRLILSGVKPGDRVAIYMPRCLQNAIAVYGILNAGAVFVPIDPGAPAVSVAELLTDCEISMLVTVPQMHRLVSQLNAQNIPELTVFGLPGDQSHSLIGISWEEIMSGSDTKPNIPVSGSDLAYIIHTSGSTGKPKGIMHSNASGLSYARLSQQTYQITAHDVIGSHAPLHTDMSTLGYLTGPYVGATTVIIPESHSKMPASMCHLLEKYQLTIWYSVPLALVQMLETGILSQLDTRSLRWIVYGGEPFSLKHLMNLSSQLPSARISNAYGPAEVNQCTHFDLPAHDQNVPWQISEGTVPIGRPWPETSALVVDASDHPVADDQTGELLVSSSTMMMGYWNRPDLNGEVFHSVATETGKQVYYRTGDLVRRSTDGLLRLLGRADRQVKVRGFRIELDHIEMSLSGHPNVLETGVFAVFDQRENTNQVIAAVLTNKPDLTPDQLKTFARTRLAEAAVPRTIVIVDSLPRTTSGKIDRRQLKSDWPAQKENL
ncbi:MAG: amino acid adenylation domain-containing protein [Burkholderiaceae bacterium]